MAFERKTFCEKSDVFWYKSYGFERIYFEIFGTFGLKFLLGTESQGFIFWAKIY